MPNLKKKVCLVGNSLGKGGAEKSMAMFSKMLTDLGHEVHTVILIDDVYVPIKGALLNLGKGKLGKSSYTDRLKRAQKIRKYLLKHRFDFIIDHRPKNQYIREFIYKKYVYKNFKTIYVVHSSLQKRHFETHPKLINLFKDNHLTVAVSSYIEQMLNGHGILNTRTIYNAFSAHWHQTSSSLVEALRDKTYILSYGRLNDSVKDFKFLIKAFEYSKLWQENIFLVIMGDGEDKEAIQGYMETTACAANILLLPYQNEPYTTVKNSRCVALTSKYEGFPMVLLESLSLQVPVISLDIVSGPSEIVQNEVNGLLVLERDESLFATALKRMFAEEELYNICKQNALSSIQKFSEEDIAKKWQEVLTT